MKSSDRYKLGKKVESKKQRRIPVDSEVAVSRQFQSSLIFPIIIFLAAFLLYANTLNHGYAFDDSVVITDNAFTKKGFEGIPDLLTKDLFAGIYGKGLELSGGRYRPLPLVMFAVEYEFFGMNPFVGHFVNVLLYSLLAVLLFFLLLRIFPAYPLLAFLVSLLFTTHPIHTEVVANIKSRDEILCMLFLCLTILFLFRYLQAERKSIFLQLSYLFYFISLFAKENGITFLAVIPLCLLLFTTEKTQRILVLSSPYLLLGIAYVVIRAVLVGFIGDRDNSDLMENPFFGMDFFTKTATVMYTLGKYVQLLFFPHPLSSDYSLYQVPVLKWDNIRAIIPFVVYAVLGLFAFWQVINKNKIAAHIKIISFGILFYIATLSIVSNLVFSIGAPMGERFLFLPSLGFCLVIAVLFLRLLKLPITEKLYFTPRVFIPLGLILVLFSWKTIARNSDWKDNTTLFTADVKNSPSSAKAHYYYANTLLNSVLSDKAYPGRNDVLEKAKKSFERSVEIYPAFHHSYYNLGIIFNEQSQADSALYYCRKVLTLQPTHIATQGVMGSVFGKLKAEYDSALHYLNIAVQYNKEDAGSWENLGICYAMKKDFPNSLKAFEQVQRLKPADAKMMMNIGITYHAMGDTIKSKEFFRKAEQMGLQTTK